MRNRVHVEICGIATIIYTWCFVFAHGNQNVKHQDICPSIMEGIPDQIISAGKIFKYKIPDRAFRMSKNAVIKISAASQNSVLPEWIYYNQESRELLAVPTINDGYGIYLKANVEDPSHNCQSIFDVFHISITTLSMNIKKPENPPKSKACYRGVDLIQTTLIFAVNLKELLVLDRFNLVKNLAQFLGIESSLITITTGNELFSTQGNSKSFSILASGHGNTVSIVPNATELTWQVPCSVFSEVHLFVQVLQHNVEGGRLTSEVGYNVVGWYISAIVNQSKQQQDRKKRFAHRFMTPIPTPVPDIVPVTTVKPTSTKQWWWWPETTEKNKPKTSLVIERLSSEFLPIDQMTKPFPSQSETIRHTLDFSSQSSRISPTKSYHFASSSAATSTQHIKSPSSLSPEPSSTYHTKSMLSSGIISSSSSMLMTSETDVPQWVPSSSTTSTQSYIYTSSLYTTTPDPSKSDTEIDTLSGSGDSTYIDEDTIPVIETTIPPHRKTELPEGIFITPSSPITKPDADDVHPVTDMPYAGSGSGSGSDEEEPFASIQPSMHGSMHGSSNSLFVPTPSLSSVIESSETNIFYFEETATTSTSRRISSSIYIPTWDTDHFSSTTSSWDIWGTYDPWSSKDHDQTREITQTEIMESSVAAGSSKGTDVWYSEKEHSTDIWPSTKTDSSVNVWYSKEGQSSETRPSTDFPYTKDTSYSRRVEDSKVTAYTNERWLPEETEITKDTWQTSATIQTHATAVHPNFFTTSSSIKETLYSYSSNPSSSSSNIQGEISPSTSLYVLTTSKDNSVSIEENVATKFSVAPSKYDLISSSKTTGESSMYRPMIIDDCSYSQGWSCSTAATLEASSSWTSIQPSATVSINLASSTILFSMTPVVVPTEETQQTTPQPTTDHKKVTKTPKKRPTLPPITKTTDYTNKAPRVRSQIGSVYATVGMVFKFQIPKNTFHDPEDGNTRRLTLDVAYRWEPRRQPSNTNRWLEFDETTQTLIGLPLEEDTKHSPMEVTINAIDKGGKLAQDVVMLYINSTAVNLSPTYEFVMKFEVNGKKFLAERKHMRNLMKKLATYFGDMDSRYITILDARPGSLVLTWTNNSIPTDTCNNETINEQKKIIFDDRGRINQKFRKYMSPRFTILSAEFNLDGACLEPAPSDTETEDVAEVNPWAEAIIPTVIAIAIAIFIIVIILLVCSRKQSQRKNKKKEQQNSFEDHDPVMFHSERSQTERGMRAKRAIILPGDGNPRTSGHRSFYPYQTSRFGEPENCSENEEEEEEENQGRYSYSNGSTNPPPPYRLPPPYYHDNGSSYV